MSRENVEIVRQLTEAFNGEDMASMLALIAPDFEFEIPPSFSAEPDTYRGHDGVRRYFQSFHDVMSEIRFHPEHFWEQGEAVVVDIRLTAKGGQTGIPVEQRLAQAWSLRRGKARAVRSYESVSEALKAVGIEE